MIEQKECYQLREGKKKRQLSRLKGKHSELHFGHTEFKIQCDMGYRCPEAVRCISLELEKRT